MSEPIVTATFILLLLGAGEFLSIVSKARIPMLLVATIGYLTLKWTGIFPEDMVSSSTMYVFGSMMIAPLIVHMGTLVPFKLIKSQFRSVIIALSGIVVASVMIMIIVPIVFDYTSAVSGIGPLTGGTVAFVLTAEKLQELGLSGLVTIPALINALQGLIGMPLTVFFLRKHAKKVKQSANVNAESKDVTIELASTSEKEHTLLPKKYQTNIILLLQLFIGGTLATYLGNITGISYSLWALFLGIIGAVFGFYNAKSMERANSFGIAMAGLIIYILGSMNDVTPSMFVNYIPVILLIIFIGVIGIIGGSIVASKIMKWDLNKGIPVALTALLGFPSDYLLCQEVSRSVADNDDEHHAIFNEILTPMIIGGFTTVTVGSIVVVSILLETL